LSGAGCAVVAIVQRRSRGGGGSCGWGGRGWQVDGGAGIRVAFFCGVI